MDTTDQPFSPVPRELGDKLAYLIDRFAKYSERYAYQYPKWPTFDELARDISELTGKPISRSYLHELGRDQLDDPSVHHLQALAEFFGVPAAYFTDDETTAEVIAQYELVLAMRESHIREICTYAPRLDGHGLETIATLARTVAATENEAPENDPDISRG